MPSAGTKEGGGTRGDADVTVFFLRVFGATRCGACGGRPEAGVSSTQVEAQGFSPLLPSCQRQVGRGVVLGMAGCRRGRPRVLGRTKKHDKRGSHMIFIDTGGMGHGGHGGVHGVVGGGLRAARGGGTDEKRSKRENVTHVKPFSGWSALQ